MRLILCEPDDIGALQVGDRLRRDLGESVEIVTAQEIACALSWQFEIDRDDIALEIGLPDDRQIVIGEVRGALNRLHSIPHDHLLEVAGEDIDYCVQEIHAFAMAWLQSLPGIVNPPAASSLAGGYRHTSEWFRLAAQSGLPIPNYSQGCELENEGLESIADLEGDEATETVVILGDETFSPQSLPDRVHEGCRRLASMTGLPLLGATFVGSPSHESEWLFVGATPTPDLIQAGAGFPEALVRFWNHHDNESGS